MTKKDDVMKQEVHCDPDITPACSTVNAKIAVAVRLKSQKDTLILLQTATIFQSS